MTMRLASWCVALVTWSACSFTAPKGNAGDDGGGPIPTAGFLAASSLQDELSGTITVPVTLSAPAAERVSIAYEITGGTADRGADFTGSNGTLVIEAGQMEGGIELTIVADNEEEQNETVNLKLTSATGATLGNADHVLTISANLLPRAAITTSASMGLETTDVEVAVFLDVASTVNVTIDYSITGQVSSADYESVTGSFTIPAGQKNYSLVVNIVDDSLDEFDENLVVTLTNSSNVIIAAQRTRTHQIKDDDPEVAIEFAQAMTTVSEDVGSFELDVRLSTVSGKDVTFMYSTTQGTNASANDDYSYASPLSLTIPAGMTTAKIRIDFVDDVLYEIDETVHTRIDTAENADETTGTQINALTITDDDNQPTVSFGTTGCGDRVNEPVGTGNAQVAVTLNQSAISGRDTVIALVPNETNGNATVPEDYTLPSPVTIPAGQMSVTFNVNVRPDLDTTEGNEDAVFSFGTITGAMGASPTSCSIEIR